jgi:hypothetical protein
MSRCLAQLWLYRISPDDRLLAKSRDVIDFITKGNGLVITGTCGYLECWHDNQQGFLKLGETCATAYLIRFLDSMFRLDCQSLYGDIMERAIFNALFAAQSPDGRQIRYFSPFEGKREYFGMDTFCCPCNYRRIIADLPSVIYYRTRDGGLLVNLYAQSTAKLELEKGLELSVRQDTEYPAAGKVAINLEPSRKAVFPVMLRIPRWCGEVTVSVNGGEASYTVAGGSFFTIKREWKPGDRIDLTMPMEWRIIKGRNAQMSRVAVMRGPVVFTLNPEKNPNVKTEELRLLRLDPASLQGPERDDSVHSGGMLSRAKAWNPNSYGIGQADMNIILTEYADPGGQGIYFLVQNPKDNLFIDDELFLARSETRQPVFNKK